MLNLACSGLLVSWIMKHADSIVKALPTCSASLQLPCHLTLFSLQVYATSMAMLLTTGASMLLFGLAPSLQLGLGICTASISLALYYLPSSVLLSSQTPPGAAKGAGTGSRAPLLPLSREPRDA